ncbi:MAG: 2,3,4,5-tetrahydropyridine-2,6-dicarboxylate N-succinyltransferase, partial [Bacteroidales bacterium]|nr:2,3,4,5-tetrahydropyridine-2,6-dicarboxylate N-succinyltransferase [Bacteroidales bacterium]
MYQELIEKAWLNRELLKEESVKKAILEIIDVLDKGEIRVAEKINNEWQVNQWVKKAIIMYFPICETKDM